jgi:hypothetical protein
MKTEIIERLGQTDLLVPSLVAEGLAANDRVKARLSVLQAAGGRARDPNKTDQEGLGLVSGRRRRDLVRNRN